ncbi:MAG: alpha/beta fold hydrolase [Arachnia sp.]
MQRFDHDGTFNEYIDQGGGPPIVLLPGGSLNLTYLGRLSEALVQRGMRVVRIASRPASEDDSAITMHDLGSDVAAVMRHLELPPAWIAGHAFGNRVARAVALDHREAVSGVVLLAAGGTVTPAPEARDALRIAFSDVSRAEAVQSMTYFVGDPADAESAWDAIVHARSPQLGAMQRGAVVNTPIDEWSPIAPGIPAVIIQGSHDQIAPPANGEQLAESAPGQVQLVSIDGAGHLFPFLQPEATAQAIIHHITPAP